MRYDAARFLMDLFEEDTSLTSADALEPTAPIRAAGTGGVPSQQRRAQPFLPQYSHFQFEDREPDEQVDAIIPLDPCPKCGSLELWQSLAGDLCGRTSGTWRCVHCFPPIIAWRLRELAERLRNRRT